MIAADDTPVFLELLAITFRSIPELGLVATAENGRDAFDLVVAHEVDVALLDIGMPILGGFGAAAEIHQRRPETRVVLYTGMRSEIHRRRAEDLRVEVHDKLELAATIEMIPRVVPSIWPPSAA